jgi:hypothetical protein
MGNTDLLVVLVLLTFETDCKRQKSRLDSSCATNEECSSCSNMEVTMRLTAGLDRSIDSDVDEGVVTISRDGRTVYCPGETEGSLVRHDVDFAFGQVRFVYSV